MKASIDRADIFKKSPPLAGFLVSFYKVRSIFFFASLLLAVETTVLAQEKFIVRSIQFSGNKFFSSSELSAIMLTKESPAAFYRFLYRAIHVGNPPVYFDPVVFKGDVERLQQFYFDNGFYSAKLDTQIMTNQNDKTVDVKIHISEGKWAKIDSINYHGIEKASKNFFEKLRERPALKIGDRYSAMSVDSEAKRITLLLQNDGFPFAKKDSSVVTLQKIDSGTVGASVNLYFSSGRRYLWGNVNVQMADQSAINFNPHIVLREILFKKGDVYSQAMRVQSELRLYALNMFESAKISIPSAPPQSDSLPATIALRLRPTHQLAPELIMNDENNAFNFGGGLTYLHRNFFGDARLLSVATNLQLQSFELVSFNSKVLKDTVTVGRINFSTKLTQPYFFSNSSSLEWEISFLADKQRPYLQLVARNKVSVSHQFATYTMGYFSWDIERAQIDSLQAIPLPPGLERPQFNSILTFTLQRDKTNDVFSPTAGFFNLLSIEEGGVLPNLVAKVFPNSHFPYAQYWKVTIFGKWFLGMNRNSTNVLALKAKAGYAQEYGTYEQNQTGPIPLNYRFFAGGSGSLRGWRTRELGNVAQPEYGGNTILELNAEDRFPIVGSFGGVAFVDAGNLWNTYKDISIPTIALAVGFGIRYNTFFGPLRVDFGFRLFDPSAPDAQKFLFQKSLTYNLRQMVIHFGIGQAF
ncbi:MAG: BamA/OMP85 family outer membrane protein [Candidatus Kryptoniota bacterium]